MQAIEQSFGYLPGALITEAEMEQWEGLWAEDAFVTLTIYDGSGRVARSLDVGHQVAAVYESRSKAIYWMDGTDWVNRSQVVSISTSYKPGIIPLPGNW